MSEKKHYVLLEIPPTDKPIRLIIEDIGSLSELTADDRDNRRFRHEENTHPMNLFDAAVNCQPEIKFKVVDFFDTQKEGEDQMFKLLEEE